MSVNEHVQERYSAAAQSFELALCCPIADYDKTLLEAIPSEVLERDYGCGDPSRFVKEGDVVLDLGSGGGKICFIASQIVGSLGKVIGVDRNRDMLELAETSAPKVADKIGFANVEFAVGNIQDLALDLLKLESWLDDNPVKCREDVFAMEAEQKRLRAETPLIADNSIDIVLSNCVLNLVDESDRLAMFKELFRVTKVGGRVAISDIVCDQDVPQELKDDAELWSGCISGAFKEDDFLKAFADAGFYGIELVKRDPKPWQVVGGIEFRAVTIVAYKGKQGQCLEGNHAIIYPGPWKEVTDDDGHTFRRGVREAVCEKTFRIMCSEPYVTNIIGIPPYTAIPRDDMEIMPCGQSERAATETKNGPMPAEDQTVNGCCDPSGGCC